MRLFKASGTIATIRLLRFFLAALLVSALPNREAAAGVVYRWETTQSPSSIMHFQAELEFGSDVWAAGTSIFYSSANPDYPVYYVGLERATISFVGPAYRPSYSVSQINVGLSSQTCADIASAVPCPPGVPPDTPLLTTSGDLYCCSIDVTLEPERLTGRRISLGNNLSSASFTHLGNGLWSANLGDDPNAWNCHPDCPIGSWFRVPEPDTLLLVAVIGFLAARKRQLRPLQLHPSH